MSISSKLRRNHFRYNHRLCATEVKKRKLPLAHPPALLTEGGGENRLEYGIIESAEATLCYPLRHFSPSKSRVVSPLGAKAHDDDPSCVQQAG
ncbi:hypothetical protein JTE90_021234 [Oedothorax gibbosus]|uniref:Uncharacterized protein n=1 Tax=Oedothorax gibbosus TaxID=931172 RepID=A0AAV6UWY7_9ARAC|nr:hypothetical protein JTE90_021234 [Oedothorax gibbosus]